MRVLGISLGHDTNFALVEDGRVIAMMEAERYYRRKRYKLICTNLKRGPQVNTYQYIDLADLEFFLDFVGRHWDRRFDAVAVQNQGRRPEFANLQMLLRQAGYQIGGSHHVDHHLAHAALVFCTSPFDDALVLSYDGAGNDGITVLFHGRPDGLEYLERSPIQFGQNYNNLGYIIGIKPNAANDTAGKLMGLTAYGQIRSEWTPFARRYVREYRGLVRKPVAELDSYGAGHRINAIGLEDIPDLQDYVSLVEPVPGMDPARLRNGRLPEIHLSGPEHDVAQDLARTFQRVWTEEVLEVVRPFAKRSRNLCLVGGCALNGITNFAFQQAGWFDGTYMVPNASDCGLSAGAALLAYHRVTGLPFAGTNEYFSPYLGLEPFDRDELPNLRGRYPHRILDDAEVSETLARLIHDDLIVGVIRGRYEIGPRALGNRSILCNPLNPNMRDILNEKVKHREWYRPFAPVAPAEDASRYFTNTADIPYMSVICHTRPEFAERLPSITHVDGSARLQTVRREHNPFLYDTLRAFEKLSGMPILLNTSFNPAGEPILNYCAVGLEMLTNTDLDLVLIDNTFFCAPGREDLLHRCSATGRRAAPEPAEVES